MFKLVIIATKCEEKAEVTVRKGDTILRKGSVTLEVGLGCVTYGCNETIKVASKEVSLVA